MFAVAVTPQTASPLPGSYACGLGRCQRSPGASLSRFFAAVMLTEKAEGRLDLTRPSLPPNNIRLRQITGNILPPVPRSATMCSIGGRAWGVAGVGNRRGLETSGRADEDFVVGLYIGDAIHFFLDAKRAGGRSESTISEYRKKLDLFQRWAAACTLAVNSPDRRQGTGTR